MTAFWTLVIGLAVGCVLGATIIRDWLNGSRAGARKLPTDGPSRRSKTPLARTLSRAESRHLEVPTMLRRRQVIDVIDIG